MSVLPLYRNQSIDLQSKSVDWFLYEGNTGVNVLNIWDALRDLVLIVQFKNVKSTHGVATLPYVWFSCFLNYKGGNKSRKVSHIWYHILYIIPCQASIYHVNIIFTFNIQFMSCGHRVDISSQHYVKSAQS